jgi:hypothetical protein
VTRTWKDNAREFGALSKQGYGVRLALLAACSVDSESKAGGSSHFRPRKSDGRVTGLEFSRLAGTSNSTISQYLKKWDRMVEAGWDVPRSALTPAMATELVLPDGFVAEYEALTEERPGHRHLSRSGMADAIRSDPETAQVAASAVLDVGVEAMVEVASREQLEEVTEAMIQREAKEAGLPPVGPRKKPGDPRPSWELLTTRIALDGLRVVQMADELREQGRDDLAAQCVTALRQALLEILTRVELANVPETAEEGLGQ